MMISRMPFLSRGRPLDWTDPDNSIHISAHTPALSSNYSANILNIHTEITFMSDADIGCIYLFIHMGAAQ